MFKDTPRETPMSKKSPQEDQGMLKRRTRTYFLFVFFCAFHTVCRTSSLPGQVIAEQPTVCKSNFSYRIMGFLYWRLRNETHPLVSALWKMCPSQNVTLSSSDHPEERCPWRALKHDVLVVHACFWCNHGIFLMFRIFENVCYVWIIFIWCSHGLSSR